MVEVRVKEGSEVKAGDPICILSAMKVSSTKLGVLLQNEVAESDPITRFADGVCRLVSCFWSSQADRSQRE